MYSEEHSILEYKLSDNDLRSYNPYLKNLKKLIDDNRNLDADQLVTMVLDRRDDFVSEYSFTIPYYDILAELVSYSPIVEIGAGSGYWARCLSEMGADIIAYDNFPPGEASPWDLFGVNSWFEDTWYGVVKGDESAVSLHPDRALFMAWPMPMNPMAYNALVSYKNAGGKTLIFIGDPHPASSGDEYFYELLYSYKEIERTNLFSWPGIKEKLLIYNLT